MKLYELKEVDGTYVAVVPIGATLPLLKEWAITNGLLTLADYHVTVMYSRAPIVKHEKFGVEYFAQCSGFDLFGDDCLVMLLDCLQLSERHEELMSRGGTYDFPSYKPHIIIGKGKREQLTSLTIPNFSIVLGNEYWEPLDLS